MKKKIFSLALVVCCTAVIAFGGTMAYFTADDVATNVITSGKIDIKLNEVTLKVDPETGESIPFENVTGVMPNEQIDKIVSVENINLAEPAYIRVWVEPEIKLSAENTDKQGNVDYGLIIIDFNDKDWTYKEGYWYYNKVLDTSAETEPLFTKVEFSKDMGNMYQDAQVTVHVIAQAVQSKNNPGTSALTAQGWPSAEE
ncbi:MAG: SipW-dependent-type signal peptide-containing protein [Lachnospiraceae bacterium]|nr:SipW-dependent-type signal peptide-containing protein [Lachnospiraceae bacterium]